MPDHLNLSSHQSKSAPASKPARRRLVAGGALAVAMLAAGCATHESTTVSRSTALAASEGVVVLRLVNLDSLPIYRLTVRAERDQQTYEVSGVRFGQTAALTLVGRLPTGRYQLIELHAQAQVGTAIQRATIPVAALTGKFDVEPHRTTDLGTLVYVTAGEAVYKAREGLDRLLARGTASTQSFVLALDPTPVASQALLAARFPTYASAASANTTLGWVAGSLPQQQPGLLRQIASVVAASAAPAFVGPDRTLSGGALGAVIERRGAARSVTHWTGSVHQIDSVLVLRDG